MASSADFLAVFSAGGVGVGVGSGFSPGFSASIVVAGAPTLARSASFLRRRSSAAAASADAMASASFLATAARFFSSSAAASVAARAAAVAASRAHDSSASASRLALAASPATRRHAMKCTRAARCVRWRRAMSPISASLASRFDSVRMFAKSTAAFHARSVRRVRRHISVSTCAATSRSTASPTRRHAPNAEAIRLVRSRRAFRSSASAAARSAAIVLTRSRSRSFAASLASSSAASISSARLLRRSASSRSRAARRAAASLRSLAAAAAARRAFAAASSAAASRLARSRSAAAVSRLSRSRSAWTSSSAARLRASIFCRAARVRSRSSASGGAEDGDLPTSARFLLLFATGSPARASISLASIGLTLGRSSVESSAALFAARA